MKIDGYKCYNINRDNVKGGGVSTSYVNSDAPNVLKVLEGKRNELVVTRIDKFLKPINVINIYGKQECRTRREDLEEDWKEVLDILVKIETLEEESLLVGDMNSHIGDLVKHNQDKVSVGGALIRDLVSSDKYKLVNALDI